MLLRKINRFLAFGLIVLLLPTACKDAPTPKPRGYFRIDLPEHTYRHFDSAYPYRFDYPVYSRIVPKTGNSDEAYWMNIEFPGLRGIVYLSYKSLNGDLVQYIEDTRTLVNKHIPKSSGIGEGSLENREARVYGTVFEIQGNSAASPLQFYLTDSVSHFLRGALYFQSVPNNDSLAPVIEFLKTDLNRFFSSFRWQTLSKKTPRK